ncbi:MAG: acyl-CoA thioesterase [Alphaproteobacteria bacterium]|nr:MAG: acyl-CoA thioesterase [Alphaproteobacteria bacterium]
MRSNTRRVDVEWGHCDPAGIVFFPRYFEWFDAATAHLFAACGVPKDALVARFGVVGFPIVDTRAIFHIPSRFGETVEIVTRITRLGGASLELEHRLMRGEKLAVEGFETRVLVRRAADGVGLEPCPIPRQLRELLGG